MSNLDNQIQILKEKAEMFKVVNQLGSTTKEPFVYLPDAINALRNLTNVWKYPEKGEFPIAYEKGEWDGLRSVGKKANGRCI